MAAAMLTLAAPTAPASANSKYAGIVIDAKTGETLYNSSGDAQRYPASLTKMMTLYMLFEALESGRVNLSTRIPFSAHAAAEPPTKLGLKAGQSISVETAILSLVTKSANDAATATGEFLGGSEAQFARMMTAKARQLGMNRTTFRNASGLPDGRQVTTARDMARLGIALREHYPQYYKYFSVRSFTFGKTRMGNHNRLLGKVRGVDGIKTGYTRASGFNLVSSVVADNRSIVAVVMGGRTGASRNAQMEKMIRLYLPKASKHGPGINIPKPGGVIAVAALQLPDVGPVPALRYGANNRIALAYAAPAPKPVLGRAALVETLIRQQQVTEPARASIAAPLPPEPIGSASAAAIDPVTTASTQPRAAAGSETGTRPEGWQIQIGAMPDRGAALALLDKAQSAGGNRLSGTAPFTMTYTKGATQLYRARFAGFSGQSSAVAACRTLKKKGFGCWATPN
ncbi:serine hydrolase [Pseudohoeflea coraliihabitans]|uniref:SPOR domain-containing protein n=1 Tax=Pseudohoeflea coraliihabitans TaxID=2860393 RepID=A0ABS6WRC8_9HYPH|nr:serine hydrolase [Pseudohoeflea sp. DP4N28-3]MBW3098513.1 SPOR domain-containing protein [Pseudohoeflea sp. DP4N28-3]